MTTQVKVACEYLVNYVKSFNKSRQRKLNQLRAQWGKPVERYRDFPLIAILHSILKKEAKNKLDFVDDRTWFDLNLDQIFEKIDCSVSTVGSQFLYHSLRKYEFDEKILKQRSDYYQIFQQNSDLREKIQLIMLRLKNSRSGFISHLIFNEIPEKPKIFPFIYLSSFLSIAATVAISIYPPILFVMMALAIINIILNKIYAKDAYAYFYGLNYLNIMLGMVEDLGHLNTDDEIPEIDFLKKQRKFANRLKGKIGWLVIDRSRMNELTEAFIDYLNIICLFDLVTFFRSINDLKNHQGEIQEIFKAVARLDASIGIASYLSQSEHCVPEFKKNVPLQFRQIYHPLLEKPVANDFVAGEKSCLITGSNMAGKTTFIKTVGVNFILAQTLHFCLAENAIIPHKIIKSSIQRGDQIIDGKSYYLVEVEALLEFIRLSENSHNFLFLVDEIYRGTNTVERIAAATAALEFLGRSNFVMVTTHDIELQDLLVDSYEMYHFNEQVEKDVYFFDYKIKSGPCVSRNAIKLLELTGYPKSITEQAHQLANDYSGRNPD